MSAQRAGILHEEHLLLGARLVESALGGLEVASYAGEKDLPSALKGAALADLTGSAYLLASGAGAAELARAALSGRALGVGDAAFEGCLAGDGGLVSVPLAMRTGDAEHVLLDPSARGPVLAGWLGFLAGLEGRGGRAFEGVELEDASELLVALLLAGAEAERVLSDYVSAEPLPPAGAVAPVHLDAIGALVARLPEPGGSPAQAPAFLVLVPPASARLLWRSLLSFNEVSPVGHEALRELARTSAPWGELLAQDGPCRVGREDLARWGLVRDGGDFVGARALEPR